MGVPALFRWLNNKYPKIISPVIEESIDANGLSAEVDLLPNPNGFEVDNLYLDMNGIIHPCCHPEDEDAPPDEEAMFEAIFAYIDRLFAMARPRRLLYMAIDGVAPRAKMNQQRSRRFRAAQEAQEQMDASVKFQQALRDNGTPTIPELSSDTDPSSLSGSSFDSNCITPGTSFMTNLSVVLRSFIAKKISMHPSWASIQVILSDSSVPGEGEHKIMDFIRQQQAAPGYPPNLIHVMYGLDADLIMLALATHEPNFFVLREDVFGEQSEKQRNNNCYRCGAAGHHASGCTSGERALKRMRAISPHQKKPFIWLSVAILREYLHYEFTWKRTPRMGDPHFEALIDDWIFLIFFVGNDFLPHLPSLSIHEGAIDLLLDLYKQNILPIQVSSFTAISESNLALESHLTETSITLTHRGQVNVPRVIELLSHLGSLEDKIFALRKGRHERLESSGKTNDVGSTKDRQNGSSTADASTPQGVVQSSPNSVVTRRSRIADSVSLEPTALKAQQFDPNKPSSMSTKRKHVDINDPALPEPISDVVSLSKSMLPTEPETIGNVPLEDPIFQHTTATSFGKDPIENSQEEILLWKAGAKEKYYQSKLGFASEDTESRRIMVRAYVEGLAWVMAYYYTGCVSWTWFYPFHYAPFASDFHLLAQDEINISFVKGMPFRPFEQLLGVLPGASSSLLPQPFARLMKDVKSPIVDFYPTTFKIDLNGKKHAWQGVALLPFIDENRLLEAANSIPETMLSAEERKRNTFGVDFYFVGTKSQTYAYISQMFEPSMSLSLASNPQGVEGQISTTNEEHSTASIPCEFSFSNPYPERPLSFAPALLPGAIVPPRTVLMDDFRKSKFAKQTLRSTYQVSLLHHHHHYHSMHREYDEKLVSKNAAAISDVRDFDAKDSSQHIRNPSQIPRHRSSYTPSPNRRQSAYQYGHHDRDLREDSHHHHRQQSPRTRFHPSSSPHDRRIPSPYVNTNNMPYPSYERDSSQLPISQLSPGYPQMPFNGQQASIEQGAYLYDSPYPFYSQYPSFPVQQTYSQTNPYVTYLNNTAGNYAVPPVHIPYPNYNSGGQNHNRGSTDKKM